MKNYFLACCALLVLFFAACKKDDPAPVTPSNQVTLKFEFTADTTAAYDVAYTIDTAIINETYVGQNWSKTVIVTKASATSVDSAGIIVYPPAVWVGTSSDANATVKIFVNGVEKASNSAVLAGYDRPTGLRVGTNF